jgi:DNA-binding NtrC family response regulator
VPGKKILIVEDESVIGLGAMNVLRKVGYEVISIPASGEKAIELIGQSPPDLAIIDITLSGEMDGIQVAEHISRNHEIPVIYMTAHSDKETVDRAKRTNPFGFLFKPYEDKDLLRTVEKALETMID